MKTFCSLIVLSMFYTKGFSQVSDNNLMASTADITMIGPMETEGEASPIHLPEPTSTTQASLTPVTLFPEGNEHVVTGWHFDLSLSPKIRIHIHKVNLIR